MPCLDLPLGLFGGGAGGGGGLLLFLLVSVFLPLRSHLLNQVVRLGFGRGRFSQTWIPLRAAQPGRPRKPAVWPVAGSHFPSDLPHLPLSRWRSLHQHSALSLWGPALSAGEQAQGSHWGGSFNPTCTILTSKLLRLNEGRGGGRDIQSGCVSRETFQRARFCYVCFYSTRSIAAVSCHCVEVKSETAPVVLMGLQGDFECVSIIIVTLTAPFTYDSCGWH